MKFCKHCLPTKRTSHLSLHIEYYLEKIPMPKTPVFLDGLFMDFLSHLRIVKFEKNIQREKIYNRSLIFWDEALKRGLDISAVKVLGKYMNEFRLIYKGKHYFFEGTPLNIFSPSHPIDNKIKSKKILEKNGIPVAPGRVFTGFKGAKKYVLEIGFPVVVKPNSGSLSHHITTNIKSIQGFKKAVAIAKLYRPDFIVEKFIPGGLYRITVLGMKHVFVCKKEPANVKGDGFSTIDELINKKNSSIERGCLGILNTTLHKVPVNGITRNVLKAQNLTLGSIPPKGKRVFLQDKYLLSTGCDIKNCTTGTHKSNKKLFLKVAKLFNAQVIGIDFICKDIGKSYENQLCGVLETNSLPYLDMHQNPSSGKKEDVSVLGWQTALEKLENLIM